MIEPDVSKVRKPLVYVAGPYSTPDPVENTNRAIRIADGLYETGLVVPVLPHLSMLWHAVIPHPYEFWLAYDLELLSVCDAVYRFSGLSSGADGETTAAEKLGIRVFRDRDELLEWAQRMVGS